VDLLERLAEVEANGERAVLMTVVEGEPAGAKLLVVEGGETMGDAPFELAEHADEVIRGARNRLLELGERRVFAEVYMPPPRLVIYGAVDTAEALCKAAKLLGWSTFVADARRAFITPERFPSADELIVAWPREALEQIGPDHQTAVVVLTHDAKFDQPALEATLESDAFYIGALGSRRNQEKRRARLLEAGVGEAALERISGPCGLDIGAETQEETALSILGEILAVRAGREGGVLHKAKKRIHAQEDAATPAPAA
jgi:xanthine dehydrogenase accessory factor